MLSVFKLPIFRLLQARETMTSLESSLFTKDLIVVKPEIPPAVKGK